MQHRLRGNATYIPVENIELKVNPTSEYVRHCALIINSLQDDLKEPCSIKVIAYHSNVPDCFAARIGEDEFCIFASDATFIMNSHTSSYFLSIKEIRDYLDIEDGDHLTQSGELFKDEDDLDVTEITKNHYESYPLWFSATIFICLHEIAHIINGHMDYISRDEFRALPDNEKNRLLRSLESDADCFATGNTFRAIFNIPGLRPRIDFSNAQIALDYIDLVIAVVFSNIDLAIPSFENNGHSKNRSHPFPIIRFNGCAISILSHLETYDLTLPDDRISNVLGIIMERIGYRTKFLDRNFCYEESMYSLIKENFWNYWNDQAMYLKDMEKGWNEMHPVLSVIKRKKSDISPINPWAYE